MDSLALIHLTMAETETETETETSSDSLPEDFAAWEEIFQPVDRDSDEPIEEEKGAIAK